MLWWISPSQALCCYSVLGFDVGASCSLHGRVWTAAQSCPLKFHGSRVPWDTRPKAEICQPLGTSSLGHCRGEVTDTELASPWAVWRFLLNSIGLHLSLPTLRSRAIIWGQVHHSGVYEGEGGRQHNSQGVCTSKPCTAAFVTEPAFSPVHALIFQQQHLKQKLEVTIVKQKTWT